MRDLAAPSVKSPRELQTGTQVIRIGPALHAYETANNVEATQKEAHFL